MQTFLPQPFIGMGLRELDYRRLGKQRVEAWQLLTAITEGGRWAAHPAAIMWSRYPYGLAEYGLLTCAIWIDCGYKDTLKPKFEKFLGKRKAQRPWWFGMEAFHAAHRSNLKRKDPKHYAHYKERTTLEYIWPGATPADGFRIGVK